MFARLPIDVRLLIWEEILNEPRVVHLTLQELPMLPDLPGSHACDMGREGPDVASHSATPVPMLLHLCSETRTLALKHYSLILGRAQGPKSLIPGHMHDHGVSIKRRGQKSKPYQTWTESNEVEFNLHRPKVYFNYERDILLFGSWRSVNCFPYVGPYRDHPDRDELERIQNLALIIPKSDPGYHSLEFLDRFAGDRSSARLKNLYICTEAGNLDPRRELELADAHQIAKDEALVDGLAQVFVDIWNIKTYGRKHVAVVGKGLEGLRSISRDGLSSADELRKALLKNGANSDELLKFRWVGHKV